MIICILRINEHATLSVGETNLGGCRLHGARNPHEIIRSPGKTPSAMPSYTIRQAFRPKVQIANYVMQ
jgi:hypothetical protein